MPFGSALLKPIFDLLGPFTWAAPRGDTVKAAPSAEVEAVERIFERQSREWVPLLHNFESANDIFFTQGVNIKARLENAWLCHIRTPFRIIYRGRGEVVVLVDKAVIVN